MPKVPSYLKFDKATYPFKADVNYLEHPELYLVGKGEQGVLICEPYKTGIGQHWRFKTKEVAEKSAAIIYQQFLSYLDNDDFVGADMARKYLQMGYTRARRYANYKGGKKYDANNNYAPLDRGTADPEKAAAAGVFYVYWKKATANELYATRKKQWNKNMVNRRRLCRKKTAI